MSTPIVVAQSSGPQGPNSPPKVVTVTKPDSNQAITIHLDGSTKLDLSAIANDTITLVHVGDRLIILFDNHSEVIVEPFFSDNGQPLPDITVELGPNHDVSGAEFANLFPITTDALVLTGADGPLISSGANFVSFAIDTLGPPGTPLGLLASEGANGGAGGTTNGNENQQIVPMSLTGAVITGAANEGGLTATVDQFGTGNSPATHTVATGVPGSLDALVSFGTGGPNATPFQFVSTSAADAWLKSLGLFSHGAALDTATINGNTLIASTDPAEGTPHQVFSLTINADGSWTFTLLAPLDDAAGQGTNTATIDLSGLIQAVDAAGLTITLAKDFTIVVTDDVPLLTGTTDTSGIVCEGALGSGSPGDLYGDGNAHIIMGISAVASGSLASLVAFGADGPAFDAGSGKDGFQFAVGNNATHDFGVTSHGQEVNFVTLSAATDGADGAAQTLTAWTDGGAANGGHEVFALTLNGDGTYTFTLINPLDDGPNQGETQATLDLSGLVQAVDFDGDIVALSGDFKITVHDDVVVATTNTVMGSVDEGALAFSSAGLGDLYGDGNDHTLKGAAAAVSGSLASLVSFGADGPAETATGATDGFRFAVATGTNDFNVKSHGQEVNYVTVTSSDSGTAETLTAWTNGGSVNGGHEVFTLVLNGDGSYTFTLINPLDDPSGQAENSVTLDLSSLIQASDFDGDAVTLSGDFKITVTDDVPVLTGSASSGSVDEGGLKFGLPILTPGDFFGSGNDHGAATSAGGSLASLVSFGADGPQSGSFSANSGHHTATVTETIADGFAFVGQSAASQWLTSLGLSSHDQALDFATIASATSTNGTTVTDTETLTAWTNGGPFNLGHEVFTLTLNVTTGAWTFQLVNPLDDPAGNGENSVNIDLSGLVQATDFDGDVLALSSGTPSSASDFNVTVIDDVPVLVSGHVSATVHESGLTSATDSYGVGNDHHAATSASGGFLFEGGSLNGVVSFGADGPALSGTIPLIADGFQFAVQSNTTHEFGITSHGVDVNYIALSAPTVTLDGESQTLTAYAGQGGPAVFTLTLNGDGSWAFNLLEPLDDGPNQHENGTTIDLSSLIKAVDFDGDSVTLSGDFAISVTDDVPVLTGAASGSVFEAGLTAATDPFGIGNDAGAQADPTTASGTLGIHFGADGPSIQSSTSETEGLDTSTSFNTFVANQVLGSTTDQSHIGNIDYTTTIDRTPGIPIAIFNGSHGAVLGTAIAVADAAGPFVLENVSLGATTTSQLVLSGFDALGNLIASATVSVTASTNHLTNQIFNAAGTAFADVQIAKLVVTDTDPNAAVIVDNVTAQTASSAGDTPLRFTDETTAANNVTVTDANGHAVALADLTSHGQALNFALLSPTELVAYTGGTLTASDVVFTVTLTSGAANGSYDFVLHQPLDQALSGPDALNLTFAYTAQDFDGDTASATFTVSDVDDVPVLTAAASGSVFEAGLTSTTDPYGTGNHAGAPADPITASGALGIHFGADGVAATGAVAFTNQGTAAGNVSVTDGDGHAVNLAALTSHGQPLEFALLDPQTLVAYTGATAPTTIDAASVVFSVALSAAAPNGSYDFVLDQPLDQPLSGPDALNLAFTFTAKDFDGDTASGTFTVSDIDDVPVLASGAAGLSGTVNEGGLTSATDPFGTGNEPSSATAFTGTAGALDTLVHFGADGPNATPFQFVSNAGTVLANLHLESHGAAVNFAAVTTDATGTTLAAYTGGAATGTEVFTLTLDDTGAWTFTLLAPIDHNGAATLDLSGLVQAVDFDGDAVALAAKNLQVTITDDAPLLTAKSGSVDEGGLTSATDPFDTGNDPGFATTASGSLGIHYGADGPAAAGSLAFADQAHAANNVTVTDGNGHAFALASLTSHGEAVHFGLLDSQTLVAYTGTSAPTAIDAANVVFSVTLSAAAANGSYDFVLDKPLDQPLAGEDALNLAFSYAATDFDGSSTSGSFTVAAIDDLPKLTGATSATVFEAGLTPATDPFGTGTDPGALADPTAASGSIGVDFGADGPAAPAVATNETEGIDTLAELLNFGSSIGNIIINGGHSGQAEVGEILSNVSLLVTDANGPFTLDSVKIGIANGNLPQQGAHPENLEIIGFDAAGDVIASATVLVSGTVNVDTINLVPFDAAGTPLAGVQLASLEFLAADQNANDWVQINDITVTTTTPGPLHFADLATATNDITVTDANGNHIALADLTSHGQALNFALLNPQTLVGFTGTDATHPVFTVTLSTAADNGLYDFVLDQPLDQLPGTGGALNLTFSYAAQDFDGDTASGSFTVTDVDDVPVLTAASATTVFEATLTSATDPYGSGTDPNIAQVASNSLGIHFGADGPASTSPLHFTDQVTPANNIAVTDGNGNAVALADLTSHGQALKFALLDPDTLVAFTGSNPADPAHTVFTVTLSNIGQGSYDFVLDQPLDQPAGSGELKLSFGYTVQDHDGSTASGTFTVTDIDDAPLLTAASATTVFEATLTAATDPYGSGTDPNIAQVASNSLGVHFGADGMSIQSSTSETESLDSTAAFNTFERNLDFSVDPITTHLGNFDYAFTGSGPNGLFTHNDGSRGAVLANTIAVTDAAGPFVLDNLIFGATSTSQVVLSGFDALGNLIASATVSVSASGDEYADHTFNAAGTALAGVQIAKLVLTDNDPTAAVILDSVSATTLANAPLHFTDQTEAANNIAVTDGNGNAVALADLTSHGQVLKFALIGASELVAFTGDNPNDSADTVFTVTLSTVATNGSYDFVLDQPLDQPLSGPDALHLIFNYTAQDFDGSTASASFTVTDVDDAPVLTAAASGSVFESGLTSATDPFGVGNHAGSASFVTEASGTLGIHFGADGPSIPSSTSETESLDSTAAFNTFEHNFDFSVDPVTTHLGNIDYALTGTGIIARTDFSRGAVQAETIAVTDAAGPFVLDHLTFGATTASHVVLSGFDALGNLIASATLSVTASPEFANETFDAAGTAFAGVQISKLVISDDDPNAAVILDTVTATTLGSGSPLHFTDETTAANNITVTDTHGNAVALADLTSHGQALHFTLLNPQTLVAFTGTDATDPVFTVTLSTAAPNGTYDFVLDKPLDQPLSGADALHLAFNYTAQDFDGDTASASFTVTTADDTPVLTGATTSGAVDEGGLSTASGDLYGDGNGQGQDQVVVHTATLLPGLVHFGADGPAIDQNGGASGFRFAVADGSTFVFGVKSHGQDVNYVTLSAVTETADGAEQTLTAWTNGGAAGGGHEVFTLTLDGDGNFTFTLINPLDETGQSFTSLDLSQLIEAVDFDGDAVTLAKGDFTIGVNDDAPSTLTVSASVFEAGLTSATDPFGVGSHVGSASFASEASGSLGIHFGADGPAASGSLHFTDTTTAANNVTVTDGNGDAVSLASLTSHGSAVHFTLLDADTLVAYTGTRAPLETNAANVVFSVALSAENGSYDFVLDKPLDQPLAGPDGLHFSFNYTAKDFDGSTAAGSFTVTAVDDVPTADSGTPGQVSESGLTSATDPYGTGTNPAAATQASGSFGLHFGADGPAVVTTRVDTVGIDNQTEYQDFNPPFAGNFVLSNIGSYGFDSSLLPPRGDIAGITGDTVTITDAAGPFTLNSIELGTVDGAPNSPTGGTVTLIGLDGQGDVLASVTLAVDTINTFDPATVFNASGTVFAGLQLASLEIVPSDSSHEALFNDISATRSTPPPLAFTDPTTAANDITVTDGNGNAVSLASLTSHGEALKFALLNPDTLVAYTGNDATDPAGTVFTLTLSNTAANGLYDFVLDKPLDQPLAGADALNLTFDYTARDFDGDTASGTFTVSDKDDVPTLTPAASGSVFEAGLTSATDPYGSGTGAGLPADPTLASGTLGVHFGADGPSAEQTAVETAALNSGDAAAFGKNDQLGDLHFTGVSSFAASPTGGIINAGGPTLTVVDTAGPFVLESVQFGAAVPGSIELVGLDAQGDVVASATFAADTPVSSDNLTPDQFNAAGTQFADVAIDTLELVAQSVPGFGVNNLVVETVGGVNFADQVTATNNVTVTDGHGQAVSLAVLTSHGEAVQFALLDGATLVAYTGSTPATIHDANVVFSVSLSAAAANGSYDFVLDQPLDQVPGSGGALSFMFSYTAQDFDGSTASGSFTVTDTDDAPVLAAGAVGLAGTVNEGGLTATTDPNGSGNEPSSATAFTGTTGALDTLVHFGADGPNATPFQFVASASTVLTNLHIESHDAPVNFAVVTSDATGTTLAAYTGGAATGTEVFTLTLDDTGAWTFTLLAPIDHSGSQTIDLSGLVQAVDFDGDTVALAAKDLQVTITDDKPVTAAASGSVFEAGLTSATDTHGIGSHAGSASFVTEASGSLGVHFGADGPAVPTGTTETVLAPGSSDLTTFNNNISSNNPAGVVSHVGNVDFLLAQPGEEAENPPLVAGPVVTVTDAAGPFMLTSVDVGAFNGGATSNILIDGYDALGDVIASATVTANDNALPLTTVLAAGTAFAGLELAKLTFTDLDPTPNALLGVSNLSVTTESPGPLHFSDLTTATNNITVTDGNHNAVLLADLTSHGQALEFALISPTELVAYTGALNASDIVFTVTLSAAAPNGSYDFVLDQPLDQVPGTGTLNLTFSYTAQDFDGDTASGTFTITDTDDAPLISGAASGSVFEAGLTSATDTHGIGSNAGGAVDPTLASGTLGIQFGADGSGLTSTTQTVLAPGSSDLTTFNNNISSNNAASHVGNVDFLFSQPAEEAENPPLVAGPVVTVTDAAGPFMLTSVDVGAFNGGPTSNILIDGYDALGDVIASATVTVNDNALALTPVSAAGTAFAGLELAKLTFTDLDPNPNGLAGVGNLSVITETAAAADSAPIHFTNQTTAASNVTVTDANHHVVPLTELTSHGHALAFALVSPSELVAYTGALNPSDVVFTVNLSTATPNGNYSFLLDQPLDQLPGTGGALNLAFSYTAQDFDGSTTSGTFTVTDTDDAPFAHQVTPAAIQATAASATVTLVAGTDFAFGADGPSATSPITFNTAGAHVTGPSDETFGTPIYVINGTSIEIEPGTAFQRLGAGESATLDIPYTVTDFDGSTATSDILVTIDGVNAPPVITGGTALGTITEDAALNPPNLIGNGGFETGTLSGWTSSGIVAVAGGFPHSGADAATFFEADANALPSLTQTVSTVAGQSYLLTFWALSTAANDSVVVDWNGTQVANLALPDEPHSGNYQQFFVDLTGNGGAEGLTFTYDGTVNQEMNLDDVSLVTTSNLIGNGGFESGTLSGWTPSGIVGVGGDPHSGADAANFLETDANAPPSLTQSVSTVAGQSYLLTFWALSSAANDSVVVDWNGTQVASLALPDQPQFSNYQEYFVQLTGNGGPENLTFTYDGTVNQEMKLDDVSLQPFDGPTSPMQSTSGTITFSDANVNDTHTVGSVVAEGSGYLGTFTTGPVAESGGSGSVAWQFTVAESAIAYLAAGQELKQFYDVTIDDNHGGSVTDKVEVDIFGTNDAPVIAPSDKLESASILAGGGGADMASGAIHFTDVDLTDRPTGSATVASITYTDANGHALTLTQGEINAIEGAFSVTNPGANTNNGEVDWTFSIADSQLAFLTGGQTVTLTETVTVDDHNGGTDMSTETVTLSGPNHPPVITSAPASDTVTENESLQTPPNLVVNGGFETWSYNSQTGFYTVPGWTNYTNQLYPPGVGSGAHSGAVALAAVPLSGEVGTISQTVTTEAGELYKIDFFAVPTGASTDNSLSVVWDGTTVLAQSSIASLSTNNPQSPSQYVEYTALVDGTGTDTLTFGFSTTYYWFFDDVSVTPVFTPGTEQRVGAITFNDPDLGDSHTITVTPNGSGYFGVFTPTLVDSTGTGTGAVDWTFSVADSAIQSLAAGQSVTQSYTVTINDGHGGLTSQTETITIDGVNEAPVLSSTDKVALNNEPSINALVGDGGFETTLHGPWTLVTNDSGDDQIVTGHAHSGTHSMEFGQVSGSATLTQSVSTTSGASYQLSFWLEDSGGDGSETFSASWNGVTLQSLTHAMGPASYTQYTFNVTGGSGSSTSLKFAGNNASGFWYLDDVTLTPASAPAPTGTLVSSLVGLGSGPGNVTDVDTGAKTGIAITAADTSNGSWLYSTDGTHWLAFGAVSGTNALLLAADSSTSVSFQPNPGFTGTATLTFEAWDQSSGSNGTFANASVTGGSSAFSSSTETASVTVGVPSSSPFTLQTTTDTVFYTGSTTHVVTGTNTTLGTADNLNGDGADTLNLNLSGDSSAYTFSFAAMTGSFVGFSTLALSAAPGNTVNLTFGNNNILSGQTMTVDAHLSTKGFTANALGVTDGGNFVFVAANDALNTLTGGSGNDTFDFLSANLVSTEAVNGEAGTNTLFLTDATGLSVSDTAFTGVQNIETLKVGGSGTDSLTLGSHASSMAGGAGHTLTIDDTTGTGPLTILGSAMTANMTVELTSAHFTSSDSITGGSGTDTIQLVDTGGVTVADSAFTSVHSVEILKIGGSGPDSVTLGSAASADVGGAGHTFTVDDTAGTGTLTLNASAMTANLVVELQSAEFTSSDTITGGSGSDTIQLVDTTGIVVADAAFVHVTSVETLKIGGTADDAVTLGSNASADVGGLGHLFTLDDSAALGNLYVNAAAMVANLEVLAGAGADTIVGGSGSDTFLAGIGNDIFTGGLGSNTYVFNSLNLGADQITNFNNSSRADQIQVSATGFGGQLAANEDVTSVFQTASNANFSGAGGGKGQFLFDTANHTLYYSADGATAAAHAIAQIEAGVTLTPHDIHVAA